MAINFLNKVDFNFNELERAAIQNLATDPITGVLGQLIYNTTTSVLKVCTTAQNGATNAAYSVAGGTDTNTTYTVDIPDGTTSINLKGSDASNDPIALSTTGLISITRTNDSALAFATTATDNVGTVTSVTAGGGLTQTGSGTVNPTILVDYSNVGIINDANDGTSVTLVDTDKFLFEDANGTAATAVQKGTLSQLKTYIGGSDTTYTLPTTVLGAGNGGVITLTDSAAVNAVTFEGSANTIKIGATAGADGTLSFDLQDTVTIDTKLIVSGTGIDSIITSGKGQSAATIGTDVAATLTTKGYVDGLVEGGLTFKGTFNANTGAIVGGGSIYQLVNAGTDFDPAKSRVAITQGDYYVAATAGQFYGSGGTGGGGVQLDIGDSIIGLADVAVNASIVTNWSTISQGVTVNSFTNANGTFISASTVNTDATGAVDLGTLDLSATGLSGTPAVAATQFLRGDNSWAIPAGGVTSVVAATSADLEGINVSTTAGVATVGLDINSLPSLLATSVTDVDRLFIHDVDADDNKKITTAEFTDYILSKTGAKVLLNISQTGVSQQNSPPAGTIGWQVSASLAGASQANEVSCEVIRTAAAGTGTPEAGDTVYPSVARSGGSFIINFSTAGGTVSQGDYSVLLKRVAS
jgi:hypothetical protein